jgi:hypothetical protein
MRKQNKPPDNADSAEDADLARTFERFITALERGDIEELAAALGQVPDLPWPAPERHRRPKEKWE